MARVILVAITTLFFSTLVFFTHARRTREIVTIVKEIQGDVVNVEAARDVIRRTLGASADARLEQFSLTGMDARKDGKDVFHVQSSEDASGKTHITISGSSGVAIASGFYYYMRNYANGSVTWGVNRSGIELGALTATAGPLPPIPQEEVTVISSSTVRYMYNFCTLSYSLAFASEDDWTFQVDWMALHGINLPLAAVGYEYVQSLLYLNLGLNEKDLEEFFPGPAFLGWNRMSDMDGPWSGPLSIDWQRRRAEMANRTYARMRDLGMNPVRMGFSGTSYPLTRPCAVSRLSHVMFGSTQQATYLAS